MIQDPFKPAEARRAVEAIVQRYPEGTNIAVNMTGGTKLMFAGALSACWENGLEPFYFEIRNHNVIFLRDGSAMPFDGINDVEDFFLVSECKLQKSGRWAETPIREDRINATKNIWKNRKALGKLYAKQEFRNYGVLTPDNIQFQFKWAKGEASLDERGECRLILQGEHIAIPSCEDFYGYLGGGWLEEYVYVLLRSLEEEGVVRDVRIGAEVGFVNENKSGTNHTAQEFDCVFTDGKRLWIVECKAGAVKQEHIQKLENNLKRYGGIAARGIIISSFNIPPAQKERIRQLESIALIQDDELTTRTLRKTINQ